MNRRPGVPRSITRQWEKEKKQREKKQQEHLASLRRPITDWELEILLSGGNIPEDDHERPIRTLVMIHSKMINKTK